MEVALKIGGRGLDPIQLTFLRFFIGGLVLIPHALHESRGSGYRVNAKDLLWMTASGIVGVSLSMLAYQIGVMHCNAATAAPMMCTNPLFAMLIAHALTDEKMSRRFIARIGTFTQTSICFITGAVVLLPVMLVMKSPLIAGVAEIFALILYIGVIVTGLGYTLYFLAIRWSDASTGSITFFVKPAITPIFAIAILQESVRWNMIIGIMLLIIASIIIIADTCMKNAAHGNRFSDQEGVENISD